MENKAKECGAHGQRDGKRCENGWRNPEGSRSSAARACRRNRASPTSSGVDGLYRQQYAYPPETILSHDFFERMPEEFFRFYREKIPDSERRAERRAPSARPMEAEGKLAARRGRRTSDGLHQKAGSKRVFELHGSIHRNFCNALREILFGEWVASTFPACQSAPAAARSSPTSCSTGNRSIPACCAARRAPSPRADLLIVGGTSLERLSRRGAHRLVRRRPASRSSTARPRRRRRPRQSDPARADRSKVFSQL